MASPISPVPLSFPVETEIIIKSDGRVIVADLPIELTKLVTELQGHINDGELSQLDDDTGKHD